MLYLEDYTIVHHPKANKPFHSGQRYLDFAISRSILLVASRAGGMSRRPANFWRSETSLPYSSDCKNKWNETNSEKNWYWLLFPETYTAVHPEITQLLLRNKKHECLIFSTCSWISLAETAGVWALTLVWIWVGLTADLYTNIKCHFSHKQTNVTLT